MLHALSSIVELRKAIRQQSERLRHEPDKLVAQLLDLVEVPQVRLLEPRYVLLLWPLKSGGKKKGRGRWMRGRSMIGRSGILTFIVIVVVHHHISTHIALLLKHQRVRAIAPHPTLPRLGGGGPRSIIKKKKRT
jgi:hypothetical protein